MTDLAAELRAWADTLARSPFMPPERRDGLLRDAAKALDDLTAEITRRDTERERRMHTRSDGTPKIAFESAEEAAATLVPTNWHRPYKCFDCQKWHTGKPPYEEQVDRAEKAEAQVRAVLAVCDDARRNSDSVRIGRVYAAIDEAGK